MDPDKAENEIKENTKPEIPLITAAPATAPAAPVATPIAPAAAPVTPAAAFIALVAAPTALAATLVFTRIAIPALLNQ